MYSLCDRKATFQAHPESNLCSLEAKTPTIAMGFWKQLENQKEENGLYTVWTITAPGTPSLLSLSDFRFSDKSVTKYPNVLWEEVNNEQLQRNTEQFQTAWLHWELHLPSELFSFPKEF